MLRHYSTESQLVNSIARHIASRASWRARLPLASPTYEIDLREALRLLPKVLQRPRMVSLVRGIPQPAGSMPLGPGLPHSRSPWFSDHEMRHKTCKPSTLLCSLCPQVQDPKMSVLSCSGHCLLAASKSCSQSSSHSSRPVRRTFAEGVQYTNATRSGFTLWHGKPDEVSRFAIG